MNRLYFCMLMLGLYFVMGCAEKMDSPPPVANVPESPWVMSGMSKSEGAELYASCASCHMADGSGRSDGLVPRLAGQREKVLVHKLQNIRDERTSLPIMVPFARALTTSEVTKLSLFISLLPRPEGLGSAVDASNNDYATYCAACHGTSGQGNDALFAPKLCGQHAAYLIRRISEIERNLRGDADIGMMSVLKAVNQAARNEISQWLSAGQCESKNKGPENNHEQ